MNYFASTKLDALNSIHFDSIHPILIAHPPGYARIGTDGFTLEERQQSVNKNKYLTYSGMAKLKN